MVISFFSLVFSTHLPCHEFDGVFHVPEHIYHHVRLSFQSIVILTFGQT